MIYVGSKARLAKHLLPIILKDRKPGQWYVEPFAGGFNMIDKVSGLRLANDVNPYPQSLFKALLEGWTPPDNITKEEYYAIKANPELFPSPLVTLVAYGASYGGKFWGGFAKGTDRQGNPRSHYQEAVKNVTNQSKNLKGVVFLNEDYREMALPPASLIYCDPPYQGTTGYGSEFDSLEFWQWVRKKSLEGHSLYVSEYQAPSDMVCIWEKEVPCVLASKKHHRIKTERLYMHPSKAPLSCLSSIPGTVITTRHPM